MVSLYCCISPFFANTIYSLASEMRKNSRNRQTRASRVTPLPLPFANTSNKSSKLRASFDADNNRTEKSRKQSFGSFKASSISSPTPKNLGENSDKCETEGQQEQLHTSNSVSTAIESLSLRMQGAQESNRNTFSTRSLHTSQSQSTLQDCNSTSASYRCFNMAGTIIRLSETSTIVNPLS
jgi:hypothetical protein